MPNMDESPHCFLNLKLKFNHGCLLLHYQWGLDRSPGSPMLLIWLGPLSFHCHIIVFEQKKNMTRCTSWWGQMCRLPASIYFIRNLWMCLISLQDFECAKDTWNHFREAFPVTFRVDIIQGHPFWNFTRLQHFVSYPSVEKTPQRGIIYNSVSPILSLFF